MEATGRSARAPGAWVGLGATLLLLVWHLASFDVTRLPIASDVRFYLYFAWRITEGAVPHQDFFDHKTQLASFLGAGLHALGNALGADPLLAIRVGYLALAGAAGWLACEIQRRLTGGSAVAGLLGGLAYCAFGLLGLLPATGCVPKLAFALCASASALLAHRARWLAAGLVAAVAALDWQIGALAWLGVLLASLLDVESRRRAASRVVLGGALGVLPYALFFAAHGALGDALAQSIGGSLARSAGTQARDTLSARFERIRQLVASDCPEQAWLVWLGFGGAAIAIVWLIKKRELRTLLLPLLVVHGGVICFSLFDFQLHADLFILLHGVAFFLGLLWSGPWSMLAARLGPRARPLAAGAVLLVAFVAARPGPLRPALALETPLIKARATLTDQREVAVELERRLVGRTAVFLESIEQLYLLRRENPLPLVFWNDASWAHVRREGESKDATLVRLLDEHGAEVWISARQIERDPPVTFERIVSRDEQYLVQLQWR